MKRLAILAAIAAACLLSACASTSAPKTPAQTVADLAAQVQKACAVVQPTIVSLQAQSASLTADEVADLGKAADLATKVCTASAATVPTTTVDLVQTAFPVVIKLVNAAPLPLDDKAAASLALTAAQIALSAALAQ
ncbi:hypothetical protein FHW67_002698 [Herbaspirillum sp. Sphag1AN]|uniref:hypothetical protein n=1 Tax=unclassified Herbaspirillum TaxID=2624150 RepID=UPI00161D9670|nr:MULTISPECIES: hypothetical protein [unclassified Herbaspirillum]MBB3213406.1 hypothetical protein [Herbaspirillum sp. Sphag1AN]MBB3246550.1 hypothetical protein [Herbaspirillum sp. Sphag64]